ncbi:MAG: SAM-dependent chlorinase/fluorinase [Planctomycetes bacterium]|nr:SAM-dependent chlorinase/fluorinase [Planctomycetota bacterium]
MLRITGLVLTLALLSGCSAGGGNTVVMLTDYGTRDHYVAILAANVLKANPNAKMVAITHEIHPFNIMEGAFTLAEAVTEFTPGTVFLGIVDPGVGSDRTPIVVVTRTGHILVGPDNGLFDPAIARCGGAAAVYAIENPALLRPGTMSSTFHGRDIFAPVAGHMSAGVDPAKAGPLRTDWVHLDIQPAIRERDGVTGTILQVDYYGNLLSNIPASWMEGAPYGTAYEIAYEGKTERCTWQRTYSEVPKGAYLALGNAAGNIEFARNLDDAARTLAASVGQRITLRVPRTVSR